MCRKICRLSTAGKVHSARRRQDDRNWQSMAYPFDSSFPNPESQITRLIENTSIDEVAEGVSNVSMNTI